MSAFSPDEIDYLTGGERRLGRIATVSTDGTPHVVPVGYRYNPELDTVEVGGKDPAATKHFRDVRRSGRAAIVIDDVLPPWKPRAVQVRGRAEAIGGEQAFIRIYPDHVVSWGLGGA